MNLKLRRNRSMVAWGLFAPLFLSSGTARAHERAAATPRVSTMEATATVLAAMLRVAAQTPQEEALHREMAAKEADRDRRHRAAVGKKVGGYLLLLTGLAAGAGLLYLGVEKNKEEDRKRVPDEDRVAPLYYTGGGLAGLTGMAMGLAKIQKGNAELRAIEAERIQITAGPNGGFAVRVRIGF